MADIQQLWQLGQQVQGRLQELQTELAGRTFETTAGGGMVRVTADGRGAIRSVQVDPTVFAERDAEFLGEGIAEEGPLPARLNAPWGLAFTKDGALVVTTVNEMSVLLIQ